MEEYKYSRVLGTLWDTFPGFQGALCNFVLEKWVDEIIAHNDLCNRARQESASIARHMKQKLPKNITEDDVLSFEMEREYQELLTHAPLLTHTVAGSINLNSDELEVIPVEGKEVEGVG